MSAHAVRVDAPPARLPGWEQRLAAHLAEARTWPYILGTFDCLRLALGAETALTGRDQWPDFAGTYSTRRGALLAIARFGGGTVEEALCRLFGAPLSAPFTARRGDVIHVRDPDLSHLGVCTGARVLVFNERGLEGLPLDHPFVAHAVRLG